MGYQEKLIVLKLNNGWTLDMSIHSYDLELGSWEFKKLPSLWNDRRDFGLTLICNTMILAGGYIQTDRNNATNEVLCLNLEKMKFSENAPMLHARKNFDLVDLNDDVYAIGGLVNEEWSFSVEKYNFSTGKWHDVAPLNTVMRFVTAAELDGYLYAISEYSSSMECYDPASNQWSKKAAPNSKLQHVHIDGCSGFLYAVCRGYNTGILCCTLERYDPSNNIWEEKQSSRYSGQLSVVKNRIFNCAIIDSKKKEYIVEEYNPEANEWNILTQHQ